MMETERIEIPVFPVKCKGCSRIYDGVANKACPGCKTEAIQTRLQWTREDFNKADEIIRKAKEDE